jgi:uncharacterized protein
MLNLSNIPVPLQTIALLIASNVFMTIAWYGHLKNRIGYGYFTLAQLKIIQEVITLAVFIPFAMYYMEQPFKLDYLWAALCLLGAVYFIFRT